jgi:hypothetical protein
MMDGMRAWRRTAFGPRRSRPVDASDALDMLRPRPPRASPWSHDPTSSNDESIAPTARRISIPVMDIETWDEFGMLIGDRACFDPLAVLTSSS